MIRLDEDALICDLAETYHVYDYRKLPVKLVASLAVGLREDSRIKMQINQVRATPNMLMMATIVDYLQLLFWAKTKDAAKGRNRPESIVKKLYMKNKKINAYDSGKDFETSRTEIINSLGIGGGMNGN